MTWEPISGIPTQLINPAIGFAANYYIKFYKAGTTTPILAAFNRQATDDLGNTETVDKIRIDEFGFPINNSDGVCIPHVQEIYRIVAYKNITDANNDDTSRAYYNIDNLKPGLIGFAAAGAENSAGLISYQVSATGVQSNVETKLRKYVDVKDYGAIGNGTTNDQIAFDTAIAENFFIKIPEGTYLIDGIDVNKDGLSIFFDGDVILKANSNDAILFHQQNSNCHHFGNFTVEANGRTGVIGLAVAPPSLNDTSNARTIVNCTLPGVLGNTGSNAVSELCVVQPAPTSNSRLMNHTFPKVIGGDESRVIWMKCPSIAGTQPSYSCNFFNVKASGNAGIYVDSARGCSFRSLNFFDGVAQGTTPLTTPTAIYVANQCSVTNFQNRDNNFYDVFFGDNNTRDIDLGNNFNYVFARPAVAKTQVPATVPRLQRLIWQHVNDYEGTVDAAATNNNLPSGFSASKVGGGATRVTHNLNTTNYSVVAQVVGNNNAVLMIANTAINSFDIQGRVHNSPDVADIDFHFILKTFV